MIVENCVVLSNRDTNVSKMEYKGVTIYLKGLLFVCGRKTGFDSIKYIVDKFWITHQWNFKEIYGNYFVIFIDNNKTNQILFTDNGGIFKSYQYNDKFSTSFLELIENNKELSVNNLDYFSIINFLKFGHTFFNKTLISEIKTIDNESYFEYEGGVLSKKNKNIGLINSHSIITIHDFFKNFIYAISDYNVSLDLTGGVDSRLIASFFAANNANYETALSGNPGLDDIIIAERVSNALNRLFFPTYQNISDIDEDYLMNIFERTDSQIDILVYQRNHQFNIDRIKRKIDIRINGTGGEQYKDVWWRHEFPFYNKKKSNIEKFFGYVDPQNFPSYILGEKTINHFNEQSDLFIKMFSFYLLETNSKTYDNIGYKILMSSIAGINTTIANNYLLTYAPLLEYELIKISFNLKRKKRIFNNYHRNLITKNYPSVSRIKTTEGITVSSDISQLILDVINYSICYVTRQIRKKTNKKKTNKNENSAQATNNEIYSIWRESILYRNSLDILKEYGIINQMIDYDSVPKVYVGRIITLKLLLDKLK